MKHFFVPYHIVKDKIQAIVEANKDDFVKHYGDVEVDYKYFETLSGLGMAYVAMAVEDDVVGFMGFVVNENATHKGAEAENVVFYMSKPHRGKGLGELLDFSKEEFKKIGIPRITATVKSAALARALRSNGFEKEYETWGVDCG